MNSRPWHRQFDRPGQDTLGAPLRVWVNASFMAAMIAGAALSYLMFDHAPVRSSLDSEEFGKRIEALKSESGALHRAGRDPLEIVFIGTSRTKNVALEPEIVRRAARKAGLDRPLVVSVLAVNWGGFERLQPAVDDLAEVRPDYAIVIPELLYEDFGYGSRLRFALRYLQQWFWQQDYTLFDVEGEFDASACRGFEYPVEQRARDHQRWMHVQIDGPGPRAAADALRKLAATGGRIYVAEIPVHPRLAELQREKIDPRQALALHGLDRLPNIRAFDSPTEVPDSAFCDFVHIAPEHAHTWLDPLFKRIAADRSLKEF